VLQFGDPLLLFDRSNLSPLLIDFVPVIVPVTAVGLDHFGIFLMRILELVGPRPLGLFVPLFQVILRLQLCDPLLLFQRLDLCALFIDFIPIVVPFAVIRLEHLIIAFMRISKLIGRRVLVLRVALQSRLLLFLLLFRAGWDGLLFLFRRTLCPSTRTQCLSLFPFAFRFLSPFPLLYRLDLGALFIDFVPVIVPFPAVRLDQFGIFLVRIGGAHFLLLRRLSSLQQVIFRLQLCQTLLLFHRLDLGPLLEQLPLLLLLQFLVIGRPPFDRLFVRIMELIDRLSGLLVPLRQVILVLQLCDPLLLFHRLDLCSLPLDFVPVVIPFARICFDHLSILLVRIMELIARLSGLLIPLFEVILVLQFGDPLLLFDRSNLSPLLIDFVPVIVPFAGISGNHFGILLVGVLPLTVCLLDLALSLLVLIRYSHLLLHFGDPLLLFDGPDLGALSLNFVPIFVPFAAIGGNHSGTLLVGILPLSPRLLHLSQRLLVVRTVSAVLFRHLFLNPFPLFQRLDLLPLLIDFVPVIVPLARVGRNHFGIFLVGILPLGMRFVVWFCLFIVVML